MDPSTTIAGAQELPSDGGSTNSKDATESAAPEKKKRERRVIASKKQATSRIRAINLMIEKKTQRVTLLKSERKELINSYEIDPSDVGLVRRIKVNPL